MCGEWISLVWWCRILSYFIILLGAANVPYRSQVLGNFMLSRYMSRSLPTYMPELAPTVCKEHELYDDDDDDDGYDYITHTAGLSPL